MASTKISAEIAATPHVVYDLVTDPTRLPDWDVTYSRASGLDEVEGEPAFEAERSLVNRGMHLTCRVTRAVRGTLFAFTCTGNAGETIHETFELSAGDGGAGARFSRELEFDLPGQDLGVVAQTTFAEAQVERSVEQAFARLNVLLGASGDAGSRPAEDEAETRSEDSGTISAQETYSAHPGSPDVPDRPT